VDDSLQKRMVPLVAITGLEEIDIKVNAFTVSLVADFCGVTQQYYDDLEADSKERAQRQRKRLRCSIAAADRCSLLGPNMIYGGRGNGTIQHACGNVVDTHFWIGPAAG
jgi:hypothetical protein